MDRPISIQNIQVSESLEDVVRLGVIVLRSLRIGEQSATLTQAINGITEELGKSMEHRQPSSLVTVARSRRLYHQVGIDPTKQRPSSEKLLRRILRGDPFPRINDFVDAMNYVSVRLQFPFGLYDWDRISPPVLLRMGSPNESYQGISGENLRLDGKIVLVDGEGPFGNPTHDSARTHIHRGTVRALVVVYGPSDTPRAELEEALQEIADAGKRFCDGEEALSGIIP